MGQATISQRPITYVYTNLHALLPQIPRGNALFDQGSRDFIRRHNEQRVTWREGSE
jgi:hypothetical protein